jgi:hypothetical protein
VRHYCVDYHAVGVLPKRGSRSRKHTDTVRQRRDQRSKLSIAGVILDILKNNRALSVVFCWGILWVVRILFPRKVREVSLRAGLVITMITGHVLLGLLGHATWRKIGHKRRLQLARKCPKLVRSILQRRGYQIYIRILAHTGLHCRYR